MRILNVMFGKKLGGIEQAFLDYAAAMSMQNIEVINVIHPKSDVRKSVVGKYETVSNFSKYDLFAAVKLKKLVLSHQPTMIVTHGNRANHLMRLAASNVPIVAVAHNASFTPLMKSDAIIAVTEALKAQIEQAAGQKGARVFCVPNMVHIPQDMWHRPLQWRDTPTVGTLSRLSAEKGLDTLLDAIKILKDKGMKVKARIAGDGVELKRLQEQAKKLGIKSQVEFLGWVENKATFFESIDVFCLPSKRESFGLALIEAMLYSRPCLASSTEGPIQIITNNEDGLLFERGNVTDLVRKLELLFDNKNLATKIGKNAYSTAQSYSLYTVSMKLKLTLEDIYFLLMHKKHI